MKAHQGEYLRGHEPTFLDARAPDMPKGVTTGRLRACSWCGSLPPEDVAAAIRAGCKMEHADHKYGWPHKFYLDAVPNPHAGMLEARSSSSTKSDQYPHEIREPRYNEKTAERVEDYVRYTEVPKPAAPTTWGKFYTVHMRDATPEDKLTIERAVGMHIDFDVNQPGDVQWRKFQEPTA